jgi:hypothetical protein
VELVNVDLPKLLAYAAGLEGSLIGQLADLAIS